jgi:hypothetical protein
LVLRLVLVAGAYLYCTVCTSLMYGDFRRLCCGGGVGTEDGDAGLLYMEMAKMMGIVVTPGLVSGENGVEYRSSHEAKEETRCWDISILGS